MELNLRQTISQIEVAKASLPSEAPASYGVFADGLEGVIRNAIEGIIATLNEDTGLQEDLDDPLNNIPETYEMDADEDLDDF